jgi:hypothetical protein
VVWFKPGAAAAPVATDRCLGPSDGQGMSLGDQGLLILCFPGPFEDVSGDDLVVHPLGGDGDTCAVEVSADGTTYVALGAAIENGLAQGFDLQGSGLARARFVRLVDPAGGDASGFGLDAVAVAGTVPPDPGTTGILQGRVLYPDGSTPVANVSVQVFEGRDLVGCDNVDDAGGFEIVLPPGSYQMVVMAPIPVKYIPLDQAFQVFHPLDDDTDPDVTVSAQGAVSPPTVDVSFHWPVLLLHGTLAPGHSYGPAEFKEMQPYLASDLLTALEDPRDAFLPITPLMSDNGRRTYSEYFRSLTLQASCLRPHLRPRFSIVGFSQGGLVARRIVTRVLGAGIEKVIQLGTANAGTCVGDPALCNACELLPYVCALRPDIVAGFNTANPTGHGVPFYLVAGSLIPDGCSCLSGVEDDGFIPVDSVLLLDPALFPGSGLDYDVVDAVVIGPDEVPPIGIHHYRLRREPVVLDLVHGWLRTP